MPISLPGSSQPWLNLCSGLPNFGRKLRKVRQPIMVVFFGSRLPKIPIPAAWGLSEHEVAVRCYAEAPEAPSLRQRFLLHFSAKLRPS